MASLLNVGKHSVFRLAKTGELASYHVGRKLRFTQAGVASYISAQTSQTNRANVGEVPACAPSILKTTTSAASSSGFAGATTFASTPFVIAGTELAGDIFANLIAISSLNASDPASFVSDIPFGLNGSLTLDGASALGNSFSLNGASGVQVSSGVHVSRLYVNDYSALLNLYSGKANAAIVSLFDQKTNSYNVPFVQRLAPGMPVSVIRLFERRRGFIVNKKDEHAFSSWGSLLREEVRLANRERGCASRVLLDEKLLFMKAHPSTIEGYTQELSSPQAAVSFVAQGLANVAIGCTKDAKCSENLSGQHARKLVFVGLQTEYVDLVVAKRPDTERVLRFLKEACLDPCLKETLAKVEDFDREDGNARGSRSALGGGGALEGTSALEGRNARDGVREGKNTRGSGNSSSNKSAQERGRFTQNVPSEFSRMGSIVYEC